MFVQKVILNFNNRTSGLFIRKENNIWSLDTFFNSLNLYLIKKYTDGKNLFMKLDYDGDLDIEIKYQSQYIERTLFKSNHQDKYIKIDLDELPEIGIIYPIFEGDVESIKSVTYEVDATSNHINPCVIFTTFNRQEFLIPNLQKLKTINSILPHVIVVDNGSNLKLDENEFPDDTFVVIPNKNIGGSGGFTRGMMEANKQGYSHMFIMDDDITLIPEVVEKALSLVSCLKDEHKNDWLGFSMFSNEKPLIQFELGNKWNGVRMVINNHNLDLSIKENLFKNQINTKYNYSAWWSLIMPTSVVEKYNYPLPFFIKFDDIEYGLRRNNEEIILTNGFGVWHEDFDKKYNPYLEYYLYRNALITNAIHLKHPLLASLTRYAGKNVKVYFKGWFIEMRLMNLAIDDYLKGPDYLLNLDSESKNKEIREVAKKKVNALKGIFANPFICFYYYFKLLFKYRNAKKQFNSKYSELVSEEHWKKVFDHD